jgi:N-acyl amino acid synthase FeeM
MCGRQLSKVIKIAQKNPPTVRMYDVPDHVAPREPNLGIDPKQFLAAMSPASAVAKPVGIQHGVVTLMSQRGRAAPKRTRSELSRKTRVKSAAAATNCCTLCTRIAHSPEEIEAAHQLVHRRYAWRGYDIPSPAPDDRASHADSADAPMREITFVATDDVDTVGTITLGFDGNDGLLAERTHSDAVAQRRAAGAHVCELTRLAVAERADSRSVLAALFNVAYVAGSVHGITDVFIEVNPRHVAFYTRVLGFAVAAAEKFCERVHAPSVLLTLAIEELERRLLDLDITFAPMSFSARAA